MRIAIGVVVGIVLGVVTNLISNFLAPFAERRRKLIWSIFIGISTLAIVIAFAPEDQTLPVNPNPITTSATLEAKRDEQIKSRLLRQLGSKDNKMTHEAREYISAYGWIADGSLRNIGLMEADLSSLDLKGADLQNSALNWSILERSNFMYANLQNATFFAANACGTIFAYADLRNASLSGAMLRGADFTSADLRGVSLYQADISGASFWSAKFDESTILPNGKKWNSSVDMLALSRQHKKYVEKPPNSCKDDPITLPRE